MKITRTSLAIVLLMGQSLIWADMTNAPAGGPSTSIPTPASIPEKNSTITSITGAVQSIDLTSNTVVIKDLTGYTKTMQVANNTRIILAGKTVPIADVKLGDMVTATTDTSQSGSASSANTTTP